ncbi:MAG: DUF962 domain-containing protein [Myxococcales bacterium]|nr:DUF962 domain-containing protein [Myxococcota bacterium]MDW8284117.1 DUF962 domain-containing protein [Myxococcales bacterium]
MPMDRAQLKATIKRYLDQYDREHSRLATRLTHYVGIPMIVVSIPLALVSPLLAGGLFVGGWALQLTGHFLLERNAPSLLADPLYLLVGPLWVGIQLLQWLGLSLPEYLTPAAARAGG